MRICSVLCVSLSFLGCGESRSTFGAAEAAKQTADTGEAKVLMCHYPGSSENAHTIWVDASSVDAHLATGDTLGPCTDTADTGADTAL